MPFDFDFLQGSFDVSGRRLRDLLDPASGWVDVPATSSAVVAFGGAVNIDEMWFPNERKFRLSLRLFEPSSRTWAVRWLDGRGGGLTPPVMGRWAGDRGWFTGEDHHEGRPFVARHSWSEVTDAGGRWEQSFSIDNERTWHSNWVMDFARRTTHVDHPQRPRLSDDFDFLRGRWNVHHRRAIDPIGHALGRGSEFAEFDGVQFGRSYCAGAVSVDETTLAGREERGFSFRTYDVSTQQWTIYWVNSRVGRLEPPVQGRFADGIGTFFGTEQLAGHDVRVRFVWSDITETAARWRQAFSVDGGDWDENWEMRFRRPAGGGVDDAEPMVLG